MGIPVSSKIISSEDIEQYINQYWSKDAIGPGPYELRHAYTNQCNLGYTLKEFGITGTKPGYFGQTVLKICKDGETLGSYMRNYHSLYNTFYPFEQNGRHYALYSHDYTATRVMRLPECVDIAGETGSGGGFCPTGYYVAEDCKENLVEVNGQWGLIEGTHWGDDSCWKLQYLDLSRIEEGILIRDARFGYFELQDSIKDSVSLELYCSMDEPGERHLILKRREYYDLVNPDFTWTARGRIQDLSPEQRLICRQWFDGTFCAVCGMYTNHNKPGSKYFNPAEDCGGH